MLPDVPSYLDQSKTQVTFLYQSSFVGSHLIIHLKAPVFGDEAEPDNESANYGRIEIETDNYSVLTIMKDQLAAQANQRGLQLIIDSDFNDESVFHVLERLHPQV